MDIQKQKEPKDALCDIKINECIVEVLKQNTNAPMIF